MPLSVVLLIFGGVFYYRLGDQEYGAGFIVAGISTAIGLITCFGFGWNWPGYFAGQLLLFAALTWYNLRRQKRRGW